MTPDRRNVNNNMRDFEISSIRFQKCRAVPQLTKVLHCGKMTDNVSHEGRSQTFLLNLMNPKSSY